MGGSSGNPAINEAVALLDNLAPGRLQELREQASPESRHLLEAGILAGEEDSRDPSTAVSVALAAVAVAALDEAIKRMEPALDKAYARLTFVSRWRFAAQALTVIGSATVLGSSLIGDAGWQIAAAVITLGTSIASLFAEQGERLVGGSSATAGDAFDFLSSAVFPAKRLHSEIKVYAEADPGSAELTERIREANVLCEKINGWLARL